MRPAGVVVLARTGKLGDDFIEILYEGYGPGGVAVMCDILTDNRNRTAPEIRKIFEMADGKLGATDVRWAGWQLRLSRTGT